MSIIKHMDKLFLVNYKTLIKNTSRIKKKKKLKKKKKKEVTSYYIVKVLFFKILLRIGTFSPYFSPNIDSILGKSSQARTPFFQSGYNRCYL